MNAKKIISLLLALAMVLSLAACGMEEEKPKIEGDTNDDGSITVGQAGVKVEVNEVEEHMDSAEAFAAGKWEALFAPVEIEGRAIDMLNFDLTPTAEELEAMKAEPFYGQTVNFYMSNGCTSGPTVADALGYYTEAGLTAEGFKGESAVEALGTGHATVAVNHIATMLVPVTNGVDIAFVGGGHIGCKTLYVLNDSEYKTTADLKGTAISCPNGIGASDYNIISMMLDADSINPTTDVELIQVTTDACITAMENGDISAALLSDTFAYAMVKDGKLRAVRSLLDSDFQDDNCCVMAMNGTFVKENPVHAKKIVQAVQKAHSWMRENGEEATTFLMEKGWNSGDFDMNVLLNTSLQFGVSDATTEASLRNITENYVRLGLITNMDNVDEIMALVWNPVLD